MSINQYNKIHQFGSSKPIITHGSNLHYSNNNSNKNNNGDNLYNLIYSPGNTKSVLCEINDEIKKG